MENLDPNKEGAQAPQIGAFDASLKRNNKQIRDDRAAAVGKKGAKSYRRKIEDLQDEIGTMQDIQDNAIDLSPSNAQSLTPAQDFDSDKWVTNDMELSLKMRDKKIKLNEAIARYNYLFGPTYNVISVE